MDTFKTPKLMISDHYDTLISDVDIYTEELLEKYTEDDLLPMIKYKRDTSLKFKCLNNTDYDIEGFNDPYRKYYQYDMSKYECFDVTPGVTRVRDYLQIVRSKTIEKLNEAKNETLGNYEDDKEDDEDLYQYDRDELTDEKVEDIRRSIFKDKFCFVLQINKPKISNWIMTKYTIITDFYLNDYDLDFLKLRNGLFKSNQTRNKIDSYIGNYILDEKALLLKLLDTYFTGFVTMSRYGTEIISIKKSWLFEIARVETSSYVIGPCNVHFGQHSSSIDLSFIKSLELFSGKDTIGGFIFISDLSGLVNLEYLSIVQMTLHSDSFNGLHKLIKLELSMCNTSQPDSIISLDHLVNLKILKVEHFDLSVEFKGSLEKLNLLIIGNISKTSDTCAALGRLLQSKVNLSQLNLSAFSLPSLKEEMFTGLNFLKVLRLNNIGLQNLDMCRFECLKQLEKLDISRNKIKSLSQGIFSKLNQLKWLDLSCNPISELSSNDFQGLSNLEYLSLNEMTFNSMENDSFKCLTNLKGLYIVYTRLRSKSFSYLSNLVELDMRLSGMKLEENIFANLNHLKTIKMSKDDYERINKDVLESFRKSNIELILLKTSRLQ